MKKILIFIYIIVQVFNIYSESLVFSDGIELRGNLKIILKDGNVLSGVVTEADNNKIVVKNEYGLFNIDKDKILSIEILEIKIDSVKKTKDNYTDKNNKSNDTALDNKKELNEEDLFRESIVKNFTMIDVGTELDKVKEILKSYRLLYSHNKQKSYIFHRGRKNLNFNPKYTLYQFDDNIITNIWLVVENSSLKRIENNYSEINNMISQTNPDKIETVLDMTVFEKGKYGCDVKYILQDDNGYLILHYYSIESKKDYNSLENNIVEFKNETIDKGWNFNFGFSPQAGFSFIALPYQNYVYDKDHSINGYDIIVDEKKDDYLRYIFNAGIMNTIDFVFSASKIYNSNRSIGFTATHGARFNLSFIQFYSHSYIGRFLFKYKYGRTGDKRQYLFESGLVYTIERNSLLKYRLTYTNETIQTFYVDDPTEFVTATDKHISKTYYPSMNILFGPTFLWGATGNHGNVFQEIGVYLEYLFGISMISQNTAKNGPYFNFMTNFGFGFFYRIGYNRSVY